MRRRLLIAVSLFAIPVLLGLAAVLFLPAERIGRFVAARAEAALERDVSVARIRIRIIPQPAIVLEKVSIGGATPNSKLAVADRVELRPKLLPLLQRRAVIDEIVLDRPQVAIAINADGTSNLPTFTKSTSKKSDAELRVRAVRLNDATIVYRDARNGTAVRLAGVNQTLKMSGALAGGTKPINLVGQLAIQDIDANLPGRMAWPLRNVELRIDHNVVLDRKADRVEIEELKLAVQEIELQLAGAMRNVRNAKERAVDLRVATGDFDIEKLIASLPESLLKGSSGDALTGAAGHARIDAKISGRAAAGERPRVLGRVQLSDVALARGKHGKIISGLSGVIGFSLDSVVSPGITGELLGEPLRIAFNVRDLAAPRGTVSLKSALALAEVEKLGFFPKGTSGQGRITFDVKAAGSLLQPKEALLHGQVSLNGVQMQTATLKKPVVVEQARIALNGRNASAQQVRARIGRSDVSVDLQAQEWLPYALGDTVRYPVVNFAARSAVFDMDEILGVKAEKYRYSQLFFARLTDKPIEGKTAAEAAAEIGLGMPQVPPITMDGQIQARKFVRAGVQFDNVNVAIAARAGVLDVRSASFNMMGGGVQLTGRLGLATRSTTKDVKQPLLLDYKVSDLKAQQFIQRFTTFRDKISGQMLLAGSVQMNLDQQLLPVRESLGGKGTIDIVDGEIVNWPLLRVLGQRLGTTDFDTVAFKDWKGKYSFVGPRMLIEESEMDAREMNIRAAGSVDLNGTLDLGATLLLPQQYTQRVAGSSAKLVKAASDSTGRVPVGARIKGTARQPAIALDMSEAGTRVADAARAAAKQEASKAATRVVDKITDRILPSDSASSTDSTRSKVENAIGDRLKKLMKPKTGSSLF